MQQLVLIVAVAAALLGGAFWWSNISQGGAAMASCQIPEVRQFDFWVGEWDLTWEAEQGLAKGANQIRYILNGCVIEENFSDPAGSFYGKSVSAYNMRQGRWQQTWVDNNGTYLDFIGGLEGEQMVLMRQATNPQGQRVLQRMVWYNIAHQSLDWNWERSLDEGQTWDVLWKIHYQRRR